LFANVLKKFFTVRFKFENNMGTNHLNTGTAEMITDVKTAIERSSATLLGDVVGATALVIMLVVGLHLPGLI